MNRYILTTRSLVTDSRLVQGTLLVFAAIAAMFLFWGIETPVIMLFACLLIGLGYTARRLFESERRRLVPEMNEAAAKVTVASLVVFWLVSCALLVGFEGFVPEMIGGCLLCLAFALWIGSLDPLAAILLFPVYLLPVLILTSRETTKQIGDAYQSMPPVVHIVVGILLAVMGMAIVARYWFVVTSKTSPLVCKNETGKTSTQAVMWVVAIVMLVVIVQLAVSPLVEHRSASDWATSVAQVAGHMLIAYGIGVPLLLLWRMLIWAFFPRQLGLSNIGPILFSQVKHNYWKMVPWSMLAVFVVSFGSTGLFAGWATDESINAKIGFIVIFAPFLTASMLFYGLPRIFERFWIMGASERRGATARVILLLIVSQSLFLNVIAITCVTTIAMSTSLGFVPAFITGVLYLGAGAILFWVLARWYPFWLKHLSLSICLLIGGAGAAVLLTVSNSHQVLCWIAENIAVAPVSCIAAVLVTTAFWFLAIWDASRSLGMSSRLMECDNGMNDLMLQSHANG